MAIVSDQLELKSIELKGFKSIDAEGQTEERFVKNVLTLRERCRHFAEWVDGLAGLTN